MNYIALLGFNNACQAEVEHQRQLQKRGFKTTLTRVIKAIIKRKIVVDKWSPEEVAHVLSISFKSIYNWIDQDKVDLKSLIYQIMAFGIISRKRPTVPLSMDAPLSNDQQPSISDRRLVILKLIRSCLVNVKVKQWRRLLNDLVG